MNDISMKILNKLLGNTLKNIRKNKELTQNELGNLIEKKQNTIFKYESGILPITYQVWADISNKLKLSKNYFLDNLDCKLKDNINYVGADNLSDIELQEIELKIVELIEYLFVSNIDFDKRDYLNLNSRDLINLKKLNQMFFDNIYTYTSRIIFLNFSDDKEIQEKLKKIDDIEKQIKSYTDFLLKENGIIK